MSLKQVLLFDVNRVLLFDLDRILNWRIPPMLLKGLAGWFLASIALDVMDLRQGRLNVVLMAASAAAFVLPDLGRRMRAQRQANVE